MVKNYENPLSHHSGSDPLKCSTTPLSIQGSYGNEYQACSSRVLQLPNSAEILLGVASKRNRKWCISLADYRTAALITPSGNWHLSFILQLHKWVSTWISHCVRVSNYHWCLSIDSSLYSTQSNFGKMTQDVWMVYKCRGISPTWFGWLRSGFILTCMFSCENFLHLFLLHYQLLLYKATAKVFPSSHWYKSLNVRLVSATFICKVQF